MLQLKQDTKYCAMALCAPQFATDI